MIKWLLVGLIGTSLAHAKLKVEDFRLDGRLDFGIRDGLKESSDEIYDLEIDLETKRKNGNKLVMEFESNSETNQFILLEGYVDRELENENRFLFGKGKKILGFEYENPTRKRLAVSRSLMYQFVEDFAFVGYDYFAAYEWRVADPSKEGSTKEVSRVSLHSNQSEDFGIIYSHNFTPFSEWRNMIWTLLQADKARRDYQLVGMIVAGSEKRTDTEHITFEIFYGKDPAQSEFERDFDNKEDVFFAGAKAEYGLLVAEDLFPYTQVTYLAQRLDESGYDLLQALLGLRYILDEDLSVAFEFDGLQSSSRSNPWSKNWDQSEFKIELRYHF